MKVPFYVLEFHRKLKECLERVSAILETEIRPVDEESHKYDDKFALAELTTNLALDTITILLDEAFPGIGEKMKDQDSTIKYELKFEAKERCTYLEEREREIAGQIETVAETKKQSRSFVGGQSTKTKEVTTQVRTKVKEYVWVHELSYSASLVDRQDRSLIDSLFVRSRSRELITTAKEHAPLPRSKESTPIYLDLEVMKSLPRAIDRSRGTCRTPRRNEEVDAVCSAFEKITLFSRAVRSCIPGNGQAAEMGYQEQAVNDFFSPAACCFLCKSNKDDQVVIKLTTPDRASLLSEMQRTLAEHQDSIRRTCDEKAKAAKSGVLLGPDEASLLSVLRLLAVTVTDYFSSVDYLEKMLRAQLEAAVGRELTADAFEEYVLYHDRLLFSQAFKPRPFSYAVRRSPSAFPDGSVQIRTKTRKELIRTLSRDVTMTTPGPVRVALGGADTIFFDGPRYAHAYRAQTFSGAAPKPLELVATARHFSAFILLLGKVVSADEFQPDHAIIVQNKDELVIPLLLNPLPTPKEFADAIESLSPEQRAFCEAFRGMQLSSSLCSLVVIQLKPAVEKVLNLPDGALTKEIALTDQLLNLFIEFQISTDMLAYDGPQAADKATKLSAVKDHVAAIAKVIQAARDQDLKRTAEKAIHDKFEALDFYCDEAESDLLVNSIQASSRAQWNRSSFGGGGRGGGRGGKRSRAPMPLDCRSAAPMMMSMNDKSAGESPSLAPAAIVNTENNVRAVATENEKVIKPRVEEPLRNESLHDQDLESIDILDLTQLPKRLDASFKILDTDSQLRPTTIKVSDPWSRTYKKSILANPQTESMNEEALAKERNKAFDLLDAITRSGAIALGADLHVIICATHAFDKSIVDTIVMDNVNPILKCERASLIIGTTLHDRSVKDMVEPRMLDSVVMNSPLLLPAASAEESPAALDEEN